MITAKLQKFQVTSAKSSGLLQQMNLIMYPILLFINLGCVFRDVLLMSVSEGKNYWDIRVLGQLEKQSDEFVWTRLLGSIVKVKNSFFFFFLVLLSITKRKSRRRRWTAVYISTRTLHVFYFSEFFDYLQEKEDGKQFRILQLHPH